MEWCSRMWTEVACAWTRAACAEEVRAPKASAVWQMEGRRLVSGSRDRGVRAYSEERGEPSWELISNRDVVRVVCEFERNVFGNVVVAQL